MHNGQAMIATSVLGHFWRGTVASLPFILVTLPFAVLFGVAATEAGLDLVATLGMSILVLAGASQFTALQMMVDQAPAIVVLLAALAVNLRMAMYSAALAPHLGPASLGRRMFAAYLLTDQAFALSLAEYDRKSMTLPQKLAYYLGTTVPTVPFWYGGTLAGALIGARVPPEYALDFAMPLTFLALIAPMVRTLPHLLAAGVSVAGALAFGWVPYGGGVLVAAVVAMMVGAETERRLERAR